LTSIKKEPALNKRARLSVLLRAEAQAEELFDMIEESGIIAPGHNERVVEEEIYALAEREFGVTKYWHKRIVRSRINTLTIASDNAVLTMIKPVTQ
jgi:Xaa-Pro dipeptidase